MTKIFNCPNCGAPINGDLCPYCGTAFIDWSIIDIHKPNWIKIKLNDKIVLVKAVLTDLTEHICYPEVESLYTLHNKSECYYKIFPDIEIESTLRCLPFRMPGSTNEVLSVTIDKNVADLQEVGEMVHEIISKGS